MIQKSLVIAYIVVIIPLLFFYCTAPEAPVNPAKTSVETLIETADGNIHTVAIECAAGKEVRIGAAMYLSAYIDSISIRMDGLSSVGVRVPMEKRSIRIRHCIR